MATTKFDSLAKQLIEIDKRIKSLRTNAEKIAASLKKADSQGLQNLQTQTAKLNTNYTKLLSSEKELNGLRRKTNTLVKQSNREADKLTKSFDRQYQTQQALIRLKQKDIKAEAQLLAEIQRGEGSRAKTITQLEKEKEVLERLKNTLDKTSDVYRKVSDRQEENKNKTNELTEAQKKFKNQINQGVQSVKNYIKGFLGFAAAIAAIRRVIQAGQEYINLAKEQILVETKLSTVLKERTNATDEQVQSILDLTDVQQELGVVGNEVQIAGAQQFSTFVKQTSSVKTLIPALNNLLVQQKGVNATSSDAVNIANLAGRAFQGQLGALTRVGISFSEAEGKILKYGTESERAAILAKIITNNVGNMNEEIAKTDVGKIQQYNNVIGDLKEQIGNELIPIQRIFKSLSVSTFKEILDLTQDLTAPIALIKDLAESFKTAKDETEGAKENIEKFGKGLKTLINPLRALIKYNAILINGLRKTLQFFGILENEEAKRLGSITKRVADLQKEFNSLDDNIKKKVIVGFKKLKKQFDNNIIGAKQFADGINALIIKAREFDPSKQGEAIEDLTHSLTDFADSEKEYRGASDALIEFAKQGASEFEELKNSVSVTIPVVEQELSRFQKFINRVFSQKEGGTVLGRIFGGGKEGEAIAAATLNLYSQIWSFIGNQTDQEIKRLDNLISTQEKSIQKTEDRLKEEKKLYEESTKEGKAYQKSIITNLDRRLAAEKKQLASSVKAQREAKEKQKRQAIIQANIDIASSILKIFATYSPPVSFILAAIQAALGAVQLVKIKNQKFEQGGWVGGRRHKDGGTQIEAEKDEFVINRRSALNSPNLANMINDGYLTDSDLLHGRLKEKSNIFVNNNGDVVDRLDRLVENTSNNVKYDNTGRMIFRKFGNHTITFN